MNMQAIDRLQSGRSGRRVDHADGDSPGAGAAASGQAAEPLRPGCPGDRSVGRVSTNAGRAMQGEDHVSGNRSVPPAGVANPKCR